MIIKFFINYLKNLKTYLQSNKNNDLYYASSISTSCTFPILEVRRRIWLIKIFQFEPFGISYYWLDERNVDYNIEEIEEVLKNFNYSYEITELFIEMNNF